jgi:hypothetical protein
MHSSVFSWLELFLEGQLKAFICVNYKRLKVEVEECVFTIPNAGVLYGWYDPPQLSGFYQLG